MILLCKPIHLLFQAVIEVLQIFGRTYFQELYFGKDTFASPITEGVEKKYIKTVYIIITEVIDGLDLWLRLTAQLKEELSRIEIRVSSTGDQQVLICKLELFEDCDKFIEETLFLHNNNLSHHRFSSNFLTSWKRDNIKLRYSASIKHSPISSNTCITEHNASIGSNHTQHILCNCGNRAQLVLFGLLVKVVEVMTDQSQIFVNCGVVIVVLLQFVVQVPLRYVLSLLQIVYAHYHYFQEPTKLTQTCCVQNELLSDSKIITHSIGVKFFHEVIQRQGTFATLYGLFTAHQKPLQQ